MYLTEETTDAAPTELDKDFGIGLTHGWLAMG